MMGTTCGRQVGGLRDTVSPFNPHDNSGTGWTFGWADSGAFRDAMGNALYTYRQFPDSFRCARLFWQLDPLRQFRLLIVSTTPQGWRGWPNKHVGHGSVSADQMPWMQCCTAFRSSEGADSSNQSCHAGAQGRPAAWHGAGPVMGPCG